MEDNILRGGAEIQAGLELIPQIHLVSHFSCVIFLVSHFSELKAENSVSVNVLFGFISWAD